MSENDPTSPLPAAPDSSCVGVDVSGIDIDGLDALDRISGDLVDPSALFQWLLDHPADSLRTDYEVLEHAAAWERVSSFGKAQAVRSTAEFARRPEYIGVDPESALLRRQPVGQVARRYPDEELAVRLGISSRAAGSQLELGLVLSTRLPRTASAFNTGLLDVAKTRAIVDGCIPLGDDAAATVEKRVLPKAVEQDITKLRKRIRRAVLSVDPTNAEERRKQQLEDRRVWVSPGDDGMAWLVAHLPAKDAHTIELAIDAAARASKASADPTDDRTLEQRRADMLAWPFTGALQAGVLTGPSDVTLRRHRGQLPQILVTVAASTLQGFDEEPAELDGYGPITAQTARAIAAEGTWRRILTDPKSNTVLDVATTTHDPPADMARHVEIRDQTCRYPTCNRPARSAELDHTIPFPDGPTAHDNLSVLCCRHHQLKHGVESPGGAVLEQSAPGELRWTLPTGHSYDVSSGTDFREAAA
ncbi:MAG TPA: DUF222 domain-containing protein [Actinomycetes bacterium]|nr:DUF222 domain-containing protein [Actinomycetes bacterium]